MRIIWIAAALSIAAAMPALASVIHSDESIDWSWTTIVLCAIGWFMHWISLWAVEWKTKKCFLFQFIAGQWPVALFSIMATVTMYVVGPGIISGLGINFTFLPTESAATLGKVAAFASGYLADSLVSRFAQIVGRTP